jgi:hypothetical protein
MSAALIVPLAGKIVEALAGFFRDKNELSKAAKEVERILDGFLHEEQMALIAQQGEGFGRGGWFNAFVDGANRLVRPVCTYGFFAFTAYAFMRGEAAKAGVDNLIALPAPYWAVFFTIVAFWFGGRMFKDWGQFVASERPPRYQQSGSPIADSQQPPPRKPARVPVYNQ